MKIDMNRRLGKDDRGPQAANQETREDPGELNPVRALGTGVAICAHGFTSSGM
jgi:hypothetical protein